MRVASWILLHISILCILVSCTGNPLTATITSSNSDGDLEFVSTSAANSMSVTRDIASTQKVCVRLGPDTTFNQQTSVSLNLSVSSENVGSGETEEELIGRTPAIIAVRDAMFSLCMLSLNGVISDKEYAKKFSEINAQAFDLLKMEVQQETIIISESSATSGSLSLPTIQKKSDGKSSASTIAETSSKASRCTDAKKKELFEAASGTQWPEDMSLNLYDCSSDMKSIVLAK